MSVSRDEPPASASFEPLDSMKSIVEEFGRAEAIRRWEMSRPVYDPPTEPIERKFDFDVGGIEFEHGTTAIGFIFNSDVMVAVDHTMISPGEFPENVLTFNPHLLVAYSGGCPVSRHYLHHLCEIKRNQQLSATELKERLVAWFCRNPDSDNSLSLGILIAGWNAGLPYLYKVNGKGESFDKLYLGTGSASFGAVMIGARRVDVSWSLSEATKMATKALCFSVDSAPIQEEYVTVFHIGRSGTTKVENSNIEEFQKMDLKERGLEWVDPNTIPSGYMF